MLSAISPRIFFSGNWKTMPRILTILALISSLCSLTLPPASAKPGSGPGPQFIGWAIGSAGDMPVEIPGFPPPETSGTMESEPEEVPPQQSTLSALASTPWNLSAGDRFFFVTKQGRHELVAHHFTKGFNQGDGRAFFTMVLAGQPALEGQEGLVLPHSSPAGENTLRREPLAGSLSPGFLNTFWAEILTTLPEEQRLLVATASLPLEAVKRWQCATQHPGNHLTEVNFPALGVGTSLSPAAPTETTPAFIEAEISEPRESSGWGETDIDCQFLSGIALTNAEGRVTNWVIRPSLSITQAEVETLVDAEKDGTDEIVVHEFYYEGSYKILFRWDGSQWNEAILSGDGL
jgi:hypothetical protein